MEDKQLNLNNFPFVLIPYGKRNLLSRLLLFVKRLGRKGYTTIGMSKGYSQSCEADLKRRGMLI